MLRCIALVLLLLAGCSREKLASSAESAGEPLALVFRTMAYGMNPGDPDPENAPVTVVSHPGAIVVHDQLEKGVCRTKENQRAFLRGDMITLELAYPYRTGDCEAIGIPTTYQAIISEIAPGPYLFQVKAIGDVSTAHAERGMHRVIVP
jgi:hypothetical protein